MLLRTILGQQVSVAGATTLFHRLATTIGLTPGQIASQPPTMIAALGIPLKRAGTIQTVAALVRDKRLLLEERDPQKFYSQLVAIPGIGPWSAEYLQMRVLHWPDVLLAGDLGLQKALIPGRRQTERQLRIRAEGWRPWRSYATMLLWKSIEKEAST
jgi:AraC family transcriptional regulator of adaptative response / DNA-3-methyladenine glycosylase II